MERIIPSSMTGAVNQTYAQGLQTYVDYITSKGAYAIIDPHNFGRYYGNVITDYSGFQAFVRLPQHESRREHTNSLKWKTIASIYASNSKVIFDCNNEPHDMGSASVPSLMQACINGVRAAGATSQYIFVEGTVCSPKHSFHLYSSDTHLLVIFRSMDLDHIREHQPRLPHRPKQQDCLRDAPVPGLRRLRHVSNLRILHHRLRTHQSCHAMAEVEQQSRNHRGVCRRCELGL